MKIKSNNEERKKNQTLAIIINYLQSNNVITLYTGKIKSLKKEKNLSRK